MAVLGASAPAGSPVVRELATFDEVEALVLLDRDGDIARAVAVEHGGGKATAAAVDAADRQALTLVLEEYGLLLNAAGADVSLAAMDACLAAGCAYFDLGAPPPVAAGQLALNRAFAQRGLLGVLGCGGADANASVAAGILRRYARGELPAVGVLPFEQVLHAGGLDPMDQL